MRAFIQPRRCLLVVALAVSGTGMADVPALKPVAVAVTITLAIIRQATQVSSSQISQPPSLQSGPAANFANLFPSHDIFRDTPKNLDGIPNGCARHSASLCYDYRSGRAIYKPTRRLLPAIPGMTPHNLAVHRDKVVAQYTFK